MSRRTGRELTLSSIYGAPNGSRLQTNASGSGTHAVRPSRPTKPPSAARSHAPPRSASLRKADRFVRTKLERDEGIEGLQDESDYAGVERDEEVGKVSQSRDTRFSCEIDRLEVRAPRHSRLSSPEDARSLSPQASPRPTSPTGRIDAGKRVERQPPQVVMSLYGDGFIELSPNATSTSALAVPFTLQTRLFKAAHESMSRSKIESDAFRHVSPELNDEGEFVRWSCCGSTDKSVFGCPVASDEQVEKLTVEELLKLRPPKLVACKLTASKRDPMDSLRFVIFDRGYPGQLAPSDVGALNAGCRVWWQGYECWATAYEIPQDCWVDFAVTFDGQYLQIRIDDVLVDTAVVQLSSRVPTPPCRVCCPLGCLCPSTQWFSPSTATGSIYIGGYFKYSKRVNEWRERAGFVGLIAEARITVGDIMLCGAELEKDNNNGCMDQNFVHIIATDVCELMNLSTPSNHTVVVHRNVFWRKKFPAFLEPSVESTIRLLDNFYHGAHHDVSTRGHASFENLMLSTVQVGEVRVKIEVSKLFVPQFGSEHGCRTQAEYDTKCHAFVRQLEALSPLLIVLVNASGVQPPMGSFEISVELCRSAGHLVTINLHSMIATSFFPSLKDMKAKINDIISHEARRSPGEGVIHQAFRSFLSLAEQARESRERSFMESVMNRKAVITEKRLTAVFQRIGFHFSHSELQDLIRLFKTMQDDYNRHQHRIDDIPTMSLLSPSPTGLYRLPLIHHISLNAITSSEPSATKSKWQFNAIVLNYDLQLLDFVQSGCPESTCVDASYTQTRYLHGGFVDRFNIQLSNVPSHVHSILFSVRKRCSDHQATSTPSSSQLQQPNEGHDAAFQGAETKHILVQLENGETLQQLAQFGVEPTGDCKWLSLAALYRSRKSKLWRFQALGGSTQAGTILTGLEQMNSILVDRNIVQVYEIVLSYETFVDSSELAGFVTRFSKNIRFGRNGKIQIVARSRSDHARKNPDASVSDPASTRHQKLTVALRIQGVSEEIIVYRHDENSRSLPTVPSVCRSILRTLADHGIKESLQQNPFVAGAKKLKRSVTIRVTTDDTNTPISNAVIFVEKSLDNENANSALANKVVPTLTMGSRLVSIRKRLQKKKYSDEVKIATRSFVESVINLGTRYAMVSLRDSKLVPVVKSRSLLRRAMRRRHKQIREKILDAMSESERSRMYSKNGPTRLQQLFRPSLHFTPSEKELVDEVVEMELDAFRRELGLVDDEPSEVKPHDIEAVWQSHINETPQSEDQAICLESGSQDAQAGQNPQTGLDRPHAESECGLAGKKPTRSYQTDAEGIATCQLAPGSYSLHVFHNDYFEWTSLAVVFPSGNASGMYGGSVSTSAPQELVIPLEAFKWSYTIQLVDFYHQHSPKHIENVPVVIVEKVTLQETILTSRSDGSVVWDVRKGIYTVRVPMEGTSIVYSGTKSVVVDGGRFHTPRTIFIPILLGKTALELTVGDGLWLTENNSGDHTAKIEIIGENDNRFAGPLVSEKDSAHSNELVGKVNAHSLAASMNSIHQFQLRAGKYTLTVCADGYFPYSRMVHAPWNAGAADGYRELIVLCPMFTDPSTYRAVFSCVNDTGLLDAMVEVVEERVAKRTYWKHGECIPCEDVTFHDTRVIGSCEYQTFTIACLPGRSYYLRVGIRAAVRSRLRYLRPRIQVYDRSGIVLDIVLQPSTNWHGEFYWNPCSWNAQGEIVSGRQTL